MAQFRSGFQFDQAESKNCNLCLHQKDANDDNDEICMVMRLHLTWLGDEQPDRLTALELLWPMDQSKCKMFADKAAKSIADAIEFLQAEIDAFVCINSVNRDGPKDDNHSIDVGPHGVHSLRYWGGSLLECLTKAVEAKESAASQSKGDAS